MKSLALMAGVVAIALQAGRVEAQMVVPGNYDPAIGCRGFGFTFSGSGDGVNGYPVITEVQPDTPGDRAGLKKSDVLISVNDTDLVALFRAAADGRPVPSIWRHAPGTELKLTIGRDGTRKEVVLVLGRWADAATSSSGPPPCLIVPPARTSG